MSRQDSVALRISEEGTRDLTPAECEILKAYTKRRKVSFWGRTHHIRPSEVGMTDIEAEYQEYIDKCTKSKVRALPFGRWRRAWLRFRASKKAHDAASHERMKVAQQIIGRNGPRKEPK